MHNCIILIKENNVKNDQNDNNCNVQSVFKRKYTFLLISAIFVGMLSSTK